MPTAHYEPRDTTASPTGVSVGHSSISRLPAGGDVVLIQGGWLPRDQEYYWTEEWQAGERETRTELAAGNGVRFDTADDAIRWLLTDDD